MNELMKATGMSKAEVKAAIKLFRQGIQDIKEDGGSFNDVEELWYGLFGIEPDLMDVAF